MTILGIVFIILKIYDVIDWNWFWVLSPLFLAVIGQSMYSGTSKLIKQVNDLDINQKAGK